jgi:hypothetical protein
MKSKLDFDCDVRLPVVLVVSLRSLCSTPACNDKVQVEPKTTPSHKDKIAGRSVDLLIARNFAVHLL